MKKNKQVEMFQEGDDLPLFSGTPIRPKPETSPARTYVRRLSLFTCGFCHDTGVIVVNHKPHPCPCQKGTEK